MRSRPSAPRFLRNASIDSTSSASARRPDASSRRVCGGKTTESTTRARAAPQRWRPDPTESGTREHGAGGPEGFGLSPPGPRFPCRRGVQPHWLSTAVRGDGRARPSPTARGYAGTRRGCSGSHMAAATACGICCVVEHAPGDARLARLLHHRLGDRARRRGGSATAAGTACPASKSSCVHLAGEAHGRRGEHRLGDLVRLRDEDAEADAGEDEHVVALADLDRAPAVGHRVERAAGGDQRAAAGPVDDVDRLRLRLRGRVRHREDHRPLHVRRHLAHDQLGERAGLARGADQHRRLDRAHHGHQVARAALAEAAALGERGRPGERPLVLVRDLLVVDHQAVAVEVGDREVQRLAGEARALERVAQQAGDADAGRAGAEDHDALLGQRDAGRAAAGHDAGHGHRGRALDVVVEAGDALAVAVEQAEGVDLLEVLPLQQRLREAELHRAARTRRRARRTPRRAGAAGASRGTARPRAAPCCRCPRRG